MIIILIVLSIKERNSKSGPPISTTSANTKPLTTKNTMIYGVRHSWPGYLLQAQQCGAVKPINGVPTLLSLLSDN
jgi:hypothetical protein